MIEDPESWRIESSEYIEQDRWFTLRRDRVLLPSGKRIDGYPVIESPAWVTVVAVTGDDEIVLIRQYRHALGQVGLELPGGFVDDEEPIAAGQRELSEETGYGGGEWTLLQTVAPNPAILNNWNHWVLGEGVEKVDEASPDDSEDLVLDLRPRSQIMNLISSGEIHHALHVGALLKFILATG
ncbi:MAG TPA: NUDIX hydrolase [Actinomycetota bacterium]|nr:NUDIX hydrolase [Actinomycetota bacterium]